MLIRQSPGTIAALKSLSPFSRTYPGPKGHSNQISENNLVGIGRAQTKENRGNVSQTHGTVNMTTLPKSEIANKAGDAQRLESWSSAALVVLICVLTLGVFVPRFGVYYDEIVSFYILDRFGLDHLLEFTWGQARPVFAVLIWLTGNNVLFAHIVLFVFHTLNALLLLFLLRRVLRGFHLLGTLVAITYSIYPLYWLRPTNISLAIDGSLFFCLLSFALGIIATDLKGWKRWLIAALSLVFVPIYFFLYELPFPLEVLRPLLFWLSFRSPRQISRQRAYRTLIWWFPWLIVGLSLAYYRLFVFKNSGFYEQIGYNIPKISGGLGNKIIELFPPVFRDQLLGTWKFHLPLLLDTINVTHMVLAAVIVAALMIYVWRYHRADSIADKPYMVRHLVMIAAFGLVIMVLGQGTQMATLNIAQVVGLFSRWNLVSVVGVSIFWVAFLLALCTFVFGSRAKIIATLIIAPLIGAGTMLHVDNAEQFIHDWEQQRQFWWQLAWRIPDLADNTTLIVDHPYSRAQKRDIQIYETLMMGDFFFNNRTIAVVNVEQSPPGYWELNNGNWKIGWSYTTDRALLVYLNNGCLEVIDPQQPLSSEVALSLSAKGFLPVLSNPQQFIRPEATRSFPDRYKYFLPEPEHGKCYEYQKERLARQLLNSSKGTE